MSIWECWENLHLEMIKNLVLDTRSRASFEEQWNTRLGSLFLGNTCNTCNTGNTCQWTLKVSAIPDRATAHTLPLGGNSAASAGRHDAPPH